MPRKVLSSFTTVTIYAGKRQRKTDETHPTGVQSESHHDQTSLTALLDERQLYIMYYSKTLLMHGDFNRVWFVDTREQQHKLEIPERSGDCY